jgi:hypothetical protein
MLCFPFRSIMVMSLLLLLGSNCHAAAGTLLFAVEYDEGNPSYAQDDLPLTTVKPDRVTASTTLKSKSGAYEAQNAADGKPESAWCKGTEGDGIGEWLQFQFDKPARVTVLSFTPFYGKSAAVLANNNRIKRLKVEMDGGISGIAEFTDAKWCSDCQLPYPAPLVNFHQDGGRKFVTTRSIKFTVLEVYSGKKYHDTCVSDIEVMAWTGK